MKINRYLFQNKNYVIEDDIDFSCESFDPTHIKEVRDTHVKVSGQDYEDLLVLTVEVSSTVIGVCSYSLEDVTLPIKIKDTLTFSFDMEDEDIIKIDNAIFDIDSYILSLIIAEVPIKIVKKGAKLPSSGDGYRVLSEDEYQKEQETKTDDRWSKLDDIEL